MNKIIDVDEDLYMNISNIYNDAYTSFNEAKIETDGYVTTVYSSYRSAIDEISANIASLFNEAGQELVNILNKIGAIDDSIKADFDENGYDFTEVLSLLSVIPSGGKLKRADKSFFEQCPNAKVTDYIGANGMTYFRVSCNGYVYDSKTSTLTDSKGVTTTVRFYVPSNVTEVDKLNTFTALCASGELSIEQYPGMSGIDSNSLIVVPSKPVGKENSSFSDMDSGVISSTTFAKLIINQQEGCQNIIAGCSSGGCAALKIAAESDVYDTVICINNAALVGGINVLAGTKDQFKSIDDLRGLDGKNVFFISTKADPNLYHCAKDTNGWAECSDVSKSYLYSGLKLIVDNCPNSKIYLITNSDYTGFSNIGNKNNYVYSKELWKILFGNKKYSSHANYKDVLCDLINNGFTGYNSYTVL